MDLLQSGYKLYVLDFEYNIILHIAPNEESRQILQPLKVSQFSKMVYNLENSGAYGIASDLWGDMIKPLQDYYNEKKFLWMDDILATYPFCFHHRSNSLYEKEFNRFISFSLDHGLMNHWISHALIEKRESSKPMRYNFEQKIRILNLNYFTYAFYLLGVGQILAFIIFLIENIIIYIFIKV